MKTKSIISLIILGLFSTSVINADCSAFASECEAECHVTNPPCGSTSCHSGPNWAQCHRFTHQGNVLEVIDATCAVSVGAPEGSPFGDAICYIYPDICNINGQAI